ncbi:hypothetical protein D0Z08_28300 [Nocardioides immobilis]|uniref:Uncharacterized protein n=1 Tax=Nocardioides immobilis TaxID=2049295 RepID=A0A417XTD3_9ACTN|nr:hypothetical protein [Nocardioides immobilis]RHW23712.1 hypothetical protein D0Z08_28300 [Nocardioides immobilis]
MNPSSTVRGSSGQRGGRHEAVTPSSVREYRRERQHLYPYEEYEAALAVGGIVRSYCGIDETILHGDSTDLAEVADPDANDCVTCVDIWSGRQRVRL